MSNMEDSTKVNHFVMPDSDEEENDRNTTINNQRKSSDAYESEPGKTSPVPPPNQLMQETKNRPESGSLDTISGVSSCSSPAPMEPHQVRYTVKLLPKAVTKNGEITTYAIQAHRTTDGHKFVVRRQYEDFEYVSHCLWVAAFPGDGLIMAPLPTKPPVDADQVHSLSKEKLGAAAGLIGDEWNKDCYHLQVWLQLMLNHVVFGRNSDVWDKFLAARDPPARVKVSFL